MPNARWHWRSSASGSAQRRRSSSAAAASSEAASKLLSSSSISSAVDAGGLEPRADPRDAPAVDRAAVLDQQARVALVVDVALLDDDRERLLDRRRREPRPLEPRAQLGDAVLAPGDQAVAARERVVELAAARRRCVGVGPASLGRLGRPRPPTPARPRSGGALVGDRDLGHLALEVDRLVVGADATAPASIGATSAFETPTAA